MRRILLIILSITLSFPVFADEVKDSLWAKGVETYSEGDFEEALKNFSELENLGYASPELYYNIGNCYFKKENFIGKSILYYERALKADPSFDDAENNLVLAQEFTLDRIDVVPEFVLITWIKQFRDCLSSNSWAYISVGLFALLAIFLLLFRFSHSVGLRKTSFAISIIALVFAIISFIFSASLDRKMKNEDEAIIMMPVTSVKSSPSSSQSSLFIIHEGTKVDVIEELGDWSRIELSDGRQGWIVSKDMEII